MSEEQEPFEPMVRATLEESDKEPFETMMRKMCSAALREMHPQAVEAEQAEKQARAQLRDRLAEKAMEKMIEAAGLPASIYHDENNTNALAKLSYAIADAMLKARGDD